MRVFAYIEKVIGTPSEVSRALGHKHRQTYDNWKSRGRIPAEQCLAVQRAVAQAGGNILLSDMRPDIYPRDAA